MHYYWWFDYSSRDLMNKTDKNSFNMHETEKLAQTSRYSGYDLWVAELCSMLFLDAK